MRARILQLKRVREVRAQQRDREYLAERQKLSAADAEVQRKRSEYSTAQQEIQASKRSVIQPGERISEIELQRRLSRLKQLEGYLVSLGREVQAAEQARQKQAAVVEERQRARRLAQRAFDQIEVLDKRMEDEETREAERQEEAMAEESRTSPRLSLDSSGPAA